jgi:hypothetical protein
LNTVAGERQKYERKEGIRERRDGGGEGEGGGGELCNSHKREIAKVGPEPHCPVYELLRTFRSKLDYLCVCTGCPDSRDVIYRDV